MIELAEIKDKANLTVLLGDTHRRKCPFSLLLLLSTELPEGTDITLSVDLLLYYLLVLERDMIRPASNWLCALLELDVYVASFPLSSSAFKYRSMLLQYP